MTSERGAVAVEFALIVPILVMLIFGIVEFGRWLREALPPLELTGITAARGELRNWGETIAETDDAWAVVAV